ncbi:YppE family protein [Halalkalibacter okhensis]|uniref:DUF1798 family protein n=1 Tax=Halalkalibacter okhensis TaxID=333138 RepID=A0A0B0IHF8_9BACI|nr:YppE family protein [Halalkalibacter okhensis]KHF40292.1 hypothetical protein LQ50_09840 [Halalkalibacter okhensis]
MNEVNRSKLMTLTDELRHLNKEAEKMYVDIVKVDENYKPDFYGAVKPFAEKIDQIRSEWLPLAKQFVQQEKPLHLHPSQLQQTEENLEIVAIKTFYKGTGRKRQMETYKSVEYVLQQLSEALKS